MSTAKGKTPRDVVKKPSTPAKPKADKPQADNPTKGDAPLQVALGQGTQLSGALVSSSAETLIGSSKFDATYEIGGQTVQLGTLVLEAHKRSGVSLEEWNKLPDAERDTMIGKVLEEMQAVAAAATATTTMTAAVGPDSPGWNSRRAEGVRRTGWRWRRGRQGRAGRRRQWRRRRRDGRPRGW